MWREFEHPLRNILLLYSSALYYPKPCASVDRPSLTLHWRERIRTQALPWLPLQWQVRQFRHPLHPPASLASPVSPVVMVIECAEKWTCPIISKLISKTNIICTYLYINSKISGLIISSINTCRFDIVETLISNLVYARSMLTAFGIVWVVFLVYIFMLLQTRKQLNKQMELLGHLKD